MELAEDLINKYSMAEMNLEFIKDVMNKLKPTISKFMTLYNDIADSVMPIWFLVAMKVIYPRCLRE